jgi:2',3'-cyclic-nucleotide 2'-phosphodiesterase (5'-nucleotidase family)
MRPSGRRPVALVGLFGTMALMLCVAAAGFADTLKAEVELTTKEVGSKECVLGDIIADAIKASAKTDAAFIAADYFNEVTIPKGNTSTAEVLKALEARSDTIAIVKLTGEQISRAMERSLYLYPKSNSGFLHFSGLTVTFNPAAEADKRVVSIKVNGEALENSKTYRVAMPSPLAKGGLSYFKVWKSSDIEKDTEKTVESAVTSYLSDHKTLTKGEDRLVIKK